MKHRRNTEESNAELVSTSQALPVLGEQMPHPVVLHCRAAWCLGHLLAAALFPWWALPISQWGHAAAVHGNLLSTLCCFPSHLCLHSADPNPEASGHLSKAFREQIESCASAAWTSQSPHTHLWSPECLQQVPTVNHGQSQHPAVPPF